MAQEKLPVPQDSLNRFPVSRLPIENASSESSLSPAVFPLFQFDNTSKYKLPELPKASVKQEFFFPTRLAQKNKVTPEMPRLEVSRPLFPPLNPDQIFSGENSSARPSVLNRPLGEITQPSEDLEKAEPNLFEDSLMVYPVDAPLGYTGPSGILPTDTQNSSHFVPMEDRWRSGFPEWDRYEKEFPTGVDYPFKRGAWYDPYNQNVLKGDYPIRGQHLFLNVTAELEMLHEFRQVPTGTSAFESTVNPFSEPFFGDPNQYFSSNQFLLSFDLMHGNAAFKPIDWQFRLTSVYNLNYLDVHELAIVNPNVKKGTTREDNFLALQEYFFEWKIADLSPHYDFVSARIGSQPFISDFRGFIFDDINRGVRLFGTRLSNRDQFNIIYFDQVEKDTNSGLNTFKDRHQNVFIMNYYRQDFIFPGYTAQASFHYNHDQPSFHFDKNEFLARPDPTGVFQPHRVNAYYLGFAGQGHIGKVNVSNAFYWAFGQDSLNPIAGKEQNINAQMAAIELSLDRDWVRFRTSFFYASGDGNPNDKNATGFDTILDAPNFAGGEFSYWQRQQVQLFGVGLTTRESLVPNLRSSKGQGQSNFVNPGLLLFNFGMDFEITPKLRFITNANYLMFNTTEVLETFTFQDDISRKIGTDLSFGFEYRPLLNDNIVFEGGVSGLIPDDGMLDLYGQFDPFTIDQVANPHLDTLYSVFVKAEFVF